MSKGLSFDLKITPRGEDLCPGIAQTGESFDAVLTITVNSGGSFSHRGIDFEFASEFTPKGHKLTRLNQINERLVEGGSIIGSMEFKLPTMTIGARQQTYHGGSFSVRLWIRVNVKKTFGSVDFTQEIPSYQIVPTIKGIDPFCVRVAVAENIRIDLMIQRRKFELSDVICGAAHFLLVALKIKAFTVQLMAQEMTEINGKTKKFKNICATWEITDGAPVKGEIIPFRLYLAPLNLTPSSSNPENGYSVTHFLHFMLVTMSGEKYFKSLQIHLFKWPSLPFAFTDE